jgi:hypothetical protein
MSRNSLSLGLLAPPMAALALVSAIAAQGNPSVRSILANRRAQPGVRIVTAEDLVGVGQSTAGVKSAIQSNPLLLLTPLAAALHGPADSLINPFGLPIRGGGLTAAGDCIPHVLSIDRNPPIFSAGEPFNLVVTGAVGTASVVFWDTDPGPTNIPGLGLLHIGFSPGWFAEVIVIPPTGPFLEFVIATCMGAKATDIFIHGFTVDEPTLTTCLTNPISLTFLGCGTGCVRTPGYWKSHPCDWPAPFVPTPSQTQPQQCSITGNSNQWCVADTGHQIFIGTNQYNQAQLLCAFERTPTGNALVILAHHVIAAQLNVRSGGTPPPGTALADAMLLIGNRNILTDYVDPTSAVGAQMLALAGSLDDYNNGRSGARHCD